MQIDFEKYPDGLVPAIIQDHRSFKVLMQGFMNREAFEKTKESGLVTFYSRSKKRLWTKGEESGHHLVLKQMLVDCDHDSLLIKAEPVGPVCHTGADTCWNEQNHKDDFIYELERIIQRRRTEGDAGSYVHQLFGKGINKIAQKVGEEAVELVIEAKDVNRALFLNEAADLLFHYIVLLQAKDCSVNDVVGILEQRHQSK